MALRNADVVVFEVVDVAMVPADEAFNNIVLIGVGRCRLDALR